MNHPPTPQEGRRRRLRTHHTVPSRTVLPVHLAIQVMVCKGPKLLPWRRLSPRPSSSSGFPTCMWTLAHGRWTLLLTVSIADPVDPPHDLRPPRCFFGTLFATQTSLFRLCRVMRSTPRRSVHGGGHTILFAPWPYRCPYLPSVSQHHPLKHSNTPNHTSSFHSIESSPSQSSTILKPSSLSPSHPVHDHIDAVAGVSTWFMRSTFNTSISPVLRTRRRHRPASNQCATLFPAPQKMCSHGLQTRLTQLVFRRPERSHLPLHDLPPALRTHPLPLSF